MAFVVSTKQDKNAAAKQTKLTVIYDDANAERALATQALVVKVQGIWRSKGIPDEATVKMSEYAPGTRHGGMSVQDAIKTLSAEEKAKLIAELQAQLQK